MSIIDASTGKIIHAKRFSSRKSAHTEAENSPPEPIDGFELLAGCREDVARRFVREISPYSSILVLKFKLKKKVPLLEKGYRMAKAGNWDEAIGYFENAASKHGNCWQAFWDLGLAYEAVGKHEKADNAFVKAYDLYPEDFIAEEMAENKSLMKELQE